MINELHGIEWKTSHFPCFNLCVTNAQLTLISIKCELRRHFGSILAEELQNGPLTGQAIPLGKNWFHKLQQQLLNVEMMDLWPTYA